MNTKVCTWCETEQPLKNFHRCTRRKDGLMANCKECANKNSREWLKNNRERRKEKRQAYYRAHKKEIKRKFLKRYHSDPDLHHRVGLYHARYNRLEKTRQATAARRKRAKDKVFEAYGGYKCAACGHTDPDCLTIDHIGGRMLHCDSYRGDRLYWWLIRTGFPRGFRVLCHNCNFKVGLIIERYAQKVQLNRRKYD